MKSGFSAPQPLPPVARPAPEVSVVLPVYRNRGQLPELVRRLTSVLAARDAGWEIVFVDDRAEDGAREWIEERAAEEPRFRLVINERNLGQHRAVLEGLRAARGALTVIMDADLQDAPEDLPRLLDAWRPGIGAVLAVRRRPYQSRSRHLTGRLFKRLVRALAGGRIPPGTGIFMAIERELREEIARTRDERPYVPLLVAQSDRTLATVEIDRVVRPDGVSAYTPWRRLALGFRATSRALRSRLARTESSARGGGPPPGGEIPLRSWAAAALALLVAATFYRCFLGFADKPGGDFRAHILFARRMANAGAIHSERFGFELLTWIAAGFSSQLSALVRAAAVVATAAMAAKAWISARQLAREVGGRWAIVATPLLLFLAPITLDWQPVRHFWGVVSPLHLGQMSGLILHNPTTVVVFPLALLLFWLSWRERLAWTALLAALQCLIKPSYVLAWAPAFVLLQLLRRHREPLRLARSGLALLPAIGVLAFQFLTTDQLGTGMVWAPWVEWRRFSDNIPLSIVRSLAFPAAFTVLFFPEVRRRGDHAFAWGVFLVAFLQYALVRITGPVYSGNWSWGRYLAIYPLFLLCLARFVDVCRRPGAWRPGWRALAQSALFLVLSLHLYSGLRYFWQALRLQRF